MTTTATQDAAAIRAALKALGFNSRAVGVRTELYSMGSTIHVTIKAAEAFDARERIAAIASGAERISRDQFGEILGGGNRFVSIHFSDACREIVGRRAADAIGAAWDSADGSTLETFPVSASVRLGWSADYRQRELVNVDTGDRRLVCTPEDAAFRAALLAA